MKTSQIINAAIAEVRSVSEATDLELGLLKEATDLSKKVETPLSSSLRDLAAQFRKMALAETAAPAPRSEELDPQVKVAFQLAAAAGLEELRQKLIK